MSNMSYCRFQNTARDLADCLENMDDDDLGHEEAKARRAIVDMAIEIADNYSHLLDEV